MRLIAPIARAKLRNSGEPQRWSEHMVSKFYGGLCTKYAEAHLDDDQFKIITNYYLKDDGTLESRGSFKPLDVSAAKESIIPDSAAPLTFDMIDIAGTTWTLASWNSGAAYEVSYWDQSNNRWAGDGGGTSIKTDFTTGYKVKFLRYSINDQEDIIMFNGKDLPQRWLGAAGAATALGLTVPTLGTPNLKSEATNANERGLTVTGDYYYKFTAFYSGTSTKYGESGPTGVSSAIACTGTAAAPSQLTLQDCPDLPSGSTRGYVYRSPPDTPNGPFEYVGYYTDTTAAEFVDSVPNGSEGVEVPVDAGTPPRLKNAVSFAGRIWGIGLNASGALKNKGVYSNSGQPDYYAADSFFYLPEPIIGPKEFNQNLYWFTEKAIYVIPNGDVSTYHEPLKVSEIGCDSYDSIADVGNGLCWQYQGNVYWANFNIYNDQLGDYPFPIGNPIADQIENIASGYESNSVGVRYKDRYYLSITETDRTVNTKTLVWDVKVGTAMLKAGRYGAWTSVDWKANWLINSDGTLWSADNTNKYLMEHDADRAADYYSKTGFDAGTSYNISTYLDTGLLHFNHEWDNKLIHSMSLWCKTTGATYTANVDVNDGDFTKTLTFTFATGGSATTGFLLGTDVLGTGVLGTATGPEYRSDHQKIANGTKGRSFTFSISCSDTDNTNVLGFKIYWKKFKDTA